MIQTWRLSNNKRNFVQEISLCKKLFINIKNSKQKSPFDYSISFPCHEERTLLIFGSKLRNHKNSNFIGENIYLLFINYNGLNIISCNNIYGKMTLQIVFYLF